MIESLDPEKIRDLTAKKTEADEELITGSERLREHYGSGFRGRGVQNVVMQHDDDNVLALRKERMDDASWHRKLYRVHKIFHDLFPQHFPRFRSVLQIPEAASGGQNLKDVLRLSIRHDIGEHSVGTDRALREVFKFLASIGMEQCTDEDFIDSRGDNFKLASDGNTYYVDELSSEFFNEFTGKRDDVMRYMQTKNYSPEAMRSVSKSFDVLERMK